LLTRSADLRQARLTSVIEDIRIWTDREGADPAGARITRKNQHPMNEVGHFSFRSYSHVFGMSVPPSRSSSSYPHAICKKHRPEWTLHLQRRDRALFQKAGLGGFRMSVM
jgi:hypothetical protein